VMSTVRKSNGSSKPNSSSGFSMTGFRKHTPLVTRWTPKANKVKNMPTLVEGLKVLISSWNVGNNVPDPHELQFWLPHQDVDVSFFCSVDILFYFLFFI
jgi:hypothetical protein